MKKHDNINGWVVVDKPVGITSTAVVGKVRRGLNAAKAGHGGTLDPLASGILPIALGEATKTIPFIMDATKDYVFTVAWGRKTTTDDAEGEVVAESSHRPDADAIRRALPEFTGKIMQTPPDYSAIKQGGKRAYAMARGGEEVSLEPREVVVHRLNLVGENGQSAEFMATTGKGVYIRSIARDLARALGTVGHISALRRTRVGNFDEKKSISLDFLDDIGHSAAAVKQTAIYPVLTALDDIPALAISGEDAENLSHGRTINTDAASGMAVAVMGSRPVAIVEVAANTAAPRRVFNME